MHAHIGNTPSFFVAADPGHSYAPIAVHYDAPVRTREIPAIVRPLSHELHADQRNELFLGESGRSQLGEVGILEQINQEGFVGGQAWA